MSVGTRATLPTAVLLAALALAGCGGPRWPADAACGPASAAAEHAPGGQRYLLAGAEDGDRPRPVLLLLHGSGSTPEEALDVTGLDAAAERAGVVVVAPEGTGTPRGWLAFSRRGLSQTSEDRLVAVLDDAVRQRCVDRDAVTVVGGSNGAAMAAVLACVPEARVRALVMVAGATWPGTVCDGAPAVDVLTVQGRDDQVFAGIAAQVQDPCCGTVLWPARAAAQAWAEHAGCGAPRPDGPAERWTGCRDGTSVAHVEVPGAAHGWPPQLPGGALLADVVADLAARGRR